MDVPDQKFYDENLYEFVISSIIKNTLLLALVSSPSPRLKFICFTINFSMYLKFIDQRYLYLGCGGENGTKGMTQILQ